MKILEGITQGSDQWLAIRQNYLCASEAAAMFGYDKNTSRTELLRIKTAGTQREFSEWTQKHLLDKGHEIEASSARFAEEIIGRELYQSVGTAMVSGLNLLASFDGISVDDSLIWECKSHNKDLAAALAEGDLPDSHWPQVEHQLLVSGAVKALFTVGDGTKEGTGFLWYESKPERRRALIAAWKQFSIDMAAYEHVETAPATVIAPIEDLPALMVELVGQVKSSNLVAFKTAVVSRIQAISTDLKTDDDFAKADKLVKFLDDGEKRLDMVKAQALAQTESIDELFRTIDSLKGEMRAKRLTLNKLVTGRKESIRIEILQGGRDALIKHIAALNTRLGVNYMPSVPCDFAGVIKGKRTIASLHDAVDTELARAKIAANEVADLMAINLRTLRTTAGEMDFLFPDESQLVLKSHDDLQATIKARISDHQAAEQKRLDAERERIRKEEADKLVREAAEQAERIRRDEQLKADAEARRNREQQAEADRVARIAREAEQRKADEAFAVEAKAKREAQRAADELLGARDMLVTFRNRYGELKEFAKVHKAIDAYMTAYNAGQQKAA